MPPDTPHVAVHYSSGRPFHSLMDLDQAGREALLRAGAVSSAARYQDPTYVETRQRVEAMLFERFVDVGGEPRIRHPHYALLGRSAKSEAKPKQRGYACHLDALPPAQVSFTWDDSFTFDATYRQLTGKEHPASGQVYRLSQLPEILERWGPATARPAWHWIELQLWFTPDVGEFEALEPMRA